MNKKTNIIKITLWGLTTLIIALTVVLGFQIKTNKQLKSQVNLLQELVPVKTFDDEESFSQYKSLFGVEDVYILTFKDDVNEKTTIFLIDDNLELTIYEALLTKMNADDFDSFDGENYYFKNAMTDVEELKDNNEYYVVDEWGTFLTVGLQAILIDKNYTVIKSGF